MDGNVQFWLGILISIPIGIATGLATPKIQDWLNNFGKARDLQKNRNTELEYKQVVHYKENPHEFTQYLAQVAIYTTFISAVMSIFATLSFILGQLFSSLPSFFLPFFFPIQPESILFILGQMVTIVGTVIIVRICSKALSVWNKVNDFENYKKLVESIVQK